MEKNSESLKPLVLIYLILSMVLHTFLCMGLVAGASFCYGIRTNLINIVNFTIGIFNTSQATVLINLTKLSVGIAYTIILVVLIKNMVDSIRTTVLWGKNSNKISAALVRTTENIGSSLFAFLFFLLSSLWVSRYVLELWVIVLIVASIVLHIIGSLIYLRVEKKIETFGSFFINLIKFISVYGILFGIGILLAEPLLVNFFNNLKYIGISPELSVVYTLYVYLVDPVLMMVLTGFFLRALYTVLQNEATHIQSSPVKVMVVFSSIIFTMNFIVKSFFVTIGETAYFSLEYLSKWYDLTKSLQLPLVLLSTALLLAVTTNIPKNLLTPKKRPSFDDSAEDETKNEKGETSIEQSKEKDSESGIQEK